MKSVRKTQIALLVVTLVLALGNMGTQLDTGTHAAAAEVVVDERPGSQNPEKTLSNQYIWAANAPWFNIEVETPNDVGKYASVAVNPSLGTIYVSHYDATNQALRIARHAGIGAGCDPQADWGCIELDGAVDLGRFGSTALNPDTGGPGITYHDATNGSLKYTYFYNPYLWTHRVPFAIDRGISGISSTGLYTSLAYGNDGRPFISYQFNNPSGVEALMLAYYSEAGGNCVNGDYPDEWRCETITTGEGVGQYTSLVMKNVGEFNWEFHIAYYDAGNGYLSYATSETHGEVGNCGPYGTDWVCYPISGGNTDVGKYASMYVDDDGNFHIAYYDDTNNKLKYAVNVGGGGNCGLLGSAQCDTIDDMPEDTHPVGISIAEDPAGYPVIAYQSKFGALNIARPLAALGMPAGSGNCGPEDLFLTWYCTTINPYNPWIPARHGDYVSLEISPSGFGTIAYYGFITTSSGGNLMVARQWRQNFFPLVRSGQ
jgi:hypothetical protein